MSDRPRCTATHPASAAGAGGRRPRLRAFGPEHDQHGDWGFGYSGGDRTVDTGIYASSLDTKEIKKVMATDYMARYASPGYLLYVQDGSLMAQQFDLETLERSGSPIPLASQIGVEPDVNVRSASFSVSSQGGLVYGSRGGLARLVWMDRSGKQLGFVGAPNNYNSLELSPDGSQVALEIMEPEGRGDLWMLDLARGTQQALTRTPDVWEYTPQWSPDGRYIAYSWTRESGTVAIHKRPADGSGAEETLAKQSSGGLKFVQDWSPDGRSILLVGPSGHLESLGLSDSGPPLRLPRSQSRELEGRFSPDGRWIAYVSNESGRNEVYVQPVSGGRRVVVSTAGGINPRWRRDGAELYYWAPGNALTAVGVEGRDEFRVGLPQELFQLPSVASGGGGRSPYTTLDGRRFLVRTAQGQTTSSMTWVLGWTTGLGQ